MLPKAPTSGLDDEFSDLMAGAQGLPVPVRVQPKIKERKRKVLRASSKQARVTEAAQKEKARPKRIKPVRKRVDYLAVPDSPESCDLMMHAAGNRKEELKSLLLNSDLPTEERGKLEKELEIARGRIFELMELKIEMVERETDAKNIDYYLMPQDSRECELMVFACG